MVMTNEVFRDQIGTAAGGKTNSVLEITGRYGAYAGKGMADGSLHMTGDAGAYACASMKGGLAIIDGNAGTGLGDRMRRGTIVVYGKAEGDVLPDMLGGTVLLLGGLADGARLCEGMNRGTVILPDETLVPPYFDKAADVDLVFLRYLFRRLADRGVRIPDEWYGMPFTRWRGDKAALGKGEIFTPAGSRE